MKQIIQSYKSGELWLAEVPVPACRAGGVLMRNRASFVSACTERMLVDLARKNIVGKALASYPSPPPKQPFTHFR